MNQVGRGLRRFVRLCSSLASASVDANDCASNAACQSLRLTKSEGIRVRELQVDVPNATIGSLHSRNKFLLSPLAQILGVVHTPSPSLVSTLAPRESRTTDLSTMTQKRLAAESFMSAFHLLRTLAHIAK